MCLVEVKLMPKHVSIIYWVSLIFLHQKQRDGRTVILMRYLHETARLTYVKISEQVNKMCLSATLSK